MRYWRFFKCARDVIRESASIQLSLGVISYFPNHKRKNTPKIQRATKAIKKCVLLTLAMIFYIKLRWPRFHASCQRSGEASVTEVLALSYKEKRNKIMNGGHILKELRRSVNLPILKWLHLHLNHFLVGPRPVPSLECLGRSSIIYKREDWTMCLQGSTFWCYDFYRKRVRNDPEPLRFTFTHGGTRTAFLAFLKKGIACHVHLTFSIVI